MDRTWRRSGRRLALVVVALLGLTRLPVASSAFSSTTSRADDRLATASVFPTPSSVVVNSTADTSDSNAGDGICSTGSTNSQGVSACSLRAAIEEANASAAVDRIVFSIPPAEGGYQNAGSYWQIAPTSAYPSIVQPVTIDATTQSGSVTNTTTFPVALDGRPNVRIDSAAPSGTVALSFVLGSGASVIRGLSITGFGGAGAAAVRLDRSNGTEVYGNFLGSAPDTESDGNEVGVDVRASTTGVKIGSPTAGDRNLIASSASAGVAVAGAGMSGNVIQGTVITNGYQYGVAVRNGAAATIGGITGGAGNQISGSGAQGVMIDADAVDASAAVLANHIFQNGALGIDLLGAGGAGVTVNDVNDGDSGPNGLLNFPVVTGTSRSGSTVAVDFTLDAPSGFYRFEIFTDPSGVDASGHGEGEVFVKAVEVFHSGGGSQAFSTTYAGAAGDRVAMTASLDLGDFVFTATSEFSAASSPVS